MKKEILHCFCSQGALAAMIGATHYPDTTPLLRQATEAPAVEDLSRRMIRDAGSNGSYAVNSMSLESMIKNVITFQWLLPIMMSLLKSELKSKHQNQVSENY